MPGIDGIELGSLTSGKYPNPIPIMDENPKRITIETKEVRMKKLEAL
jgi:hypothetical protein